MRGSSRGISPTQNFTSGFSSIGYASTKPQSSLASGQSPLARTLPSELRVNTSLSPPPYVVEKHCQLNLRKHSRRCLTTTCQTPLLFLGRDWEHGQLNFRRVRQSPASFSSTNSMCRKEAAELYLSTQFRSCKTSPNCG